MAPLLNSFNWENRTEWITVLFGMKTQNYDGSHKMYKDAMQHQKIIINPEIGKFGIYLL